MASLKQSMNLAPQLKYRGNGNQQADNFITLAVKKAIDHYENKQ